jgi:hypothetical protein
MITERQVFNGIAMGVGLYLLTYVGLWEWPLMPLCFGIYF